MKNERARSIPKPVWLLSILLVLLAPLAFAGGAAEGQQEGAKAAEQKFTIKITHVLDASHHYQAGALKFKELVEAGSNGRVTVEVYPNAQLGGERAVLEGLQLGTIEMGIITSGALSGFVPDFAILDLGYLFKDNTTAQKILNGKLGQSLSQKMEGAGIRNLGFIDCGYRSVYSQKPVLKPEDLKGMKIRTMENPAHQALFRSLGASPVPMAWPELYTGLQQGTVDAAENVIDVYYSSKHGEVAKHYSLTNHVYLVVMYMVSEKFYQSLPKDLQDLVAASAKKAIEHENGVFVQNRQEAEQKLQAAGVQVHEIADLTPFQSLARKGWAETAKAIPNGTGNLQIILDSLEK